MVWRSWWHEEIKEQYSTYYQNISLSEPGAIFTDRTGDLNAWNEAMASKKLSSIANACNQYLLPTVLCPWEYSEFIHSTGYLDVESTLQRFLQKYNFHVHDTKNFQKSNTHAMIIFESFVNTICGFSTQIGGCYQRLHL